MRVSRPRGRESPRRDTITTTPAHFRPQATSSQSSYPGPTPEGDEDEAEGAEHEPEGPEETGEQPEDGADVRQGMFFDILHI